MSYLEKRIAGLLIIASLFLGLTAVFSGTAIAAGEYSQVGSLHVRAFIDGQDDLNIRGNKVWWTHRTDDLPGRWNGNNHPTTIDGFPWYPVWPDLGDYSDVDSSAYTVTTALAKTELPVALQNVVGRGNTTISWQPSLANNYTASINIDDPEGEARFYEFDVLYYVDVKGPSTAITSPTENQTAKETIAVNAIINDSLTGNSDISGAQYKVDDGSWTSMTAADGSFDSVLENVTAQLNTAALSNGHHAISVKGKDSNGNWGSNATVGINVLNDPRPSNVSLSVTPKRIKAGKRITISGQLKDNAGNGTANKKVTIKVKVLKITKKKVKGKIKTIKRWTWKALATKTTDANGRFRYKFKLNKTSTYRAVFDGDIDYRTAKSRIVEVKVRAAI